MSHLPAAIPKNIRLVKTCEACPEQYDAFLGDRQVGYLHLRHGWFRVYSPDSAGTIVYQAHPEGNGLFMTNERHQYLTAAKDAIVRELRTQNAR